MSTYKRRFGDRKDARRLRSLEPFTQFIPYIMPTRNESNNLYEDAFRINEVDKFLHGLRRDGYKGIGLMHFIMACYVRALSQYPALNRYVAGRRIYAKHEIDAAMTVKRTMQLDGAETTIKVVLEPTDTILDVYNKLNKEIDVIKNEPEDNNTERVAAALCKLPRFLLRFVIWVLRCLDYFDLLPKSLIAASPFHETFMVTNLGSLGIRPVFHHLYNFGYLPVFVAFGAKRHAYELNAKGETVTNKYVDIRFDMDERITDGFYFAAFLKEFSKPFAHPEILLERPEKVVEDVE